MFNNSMPSLADIAAVTGNKNSDGSWGDNGAWWIIVFVLFFAFGGFGRNGWGSGNGMDSTSTAYTDSAIQRGFDNSAVISKLDGITNGLCDGFYAVNNSLLSGFNGVNTNVMQSGYDIQNAINANNVAQMQNTNALQSQIAQCCCDNRVENLQNANATQNLVSSGFSDVGYRMATDTCAITTAIAQQTQDIMQNCNANYRALHDEMVQAQIDAKNEKIAEQAQQIQNLNLAQSQATQNAYLLNALKPAPVPAFSASALYGAYTNGCTGCSGAGTIGF